MILCVSCIATALRRTRWPSKLTANPRVNTDSQTAALRSPLASRLRASLVRVSMAWIFGVGIKPESRWFPESSSGGFVRAGFAAVCPTPGMFKAIAGGQVICVFKVGAGQAAGGGRSQFVAPWWWSVSASVLGRSGGWGARWFGAGFVTGGSAGWFGVWGGLRPRPFSAVPV